MLLPNISSFRRAMDAPTVNISISRSCIQGTCTGNCVCASCGQCNCSCGCRCTSPCNCNCGCLDQDNYSCDNPNFIKSNIEKIYNS